MFYIDTKYFLQFDFLGKRSTSPKAYSYEMRQAFPISHFLRQCFFYQFWLQNIIKTALKAILHLVFAQNNLCLNGKATLPTNRISKINFIFNKLIIAL